MEEINSGGGSQLESHNLNSATRRLQSTIAQLPELQEKKRLLDMHTIIATELLRHIKASRAVPPFHWTPSRAPVYIKPTSWRAPSHTLVIITLRSDPLAHKGAPSFPSPLALNALVRTCSLQSHLTSTKARYGSPRSGSGMAPPHPARPPLPILESTTRARQFPWSGTYPTPTHLPALTRAYFSVQPCTPQGTAPFPYFSPARTLSPHPPFLASLLNAHAPPLTGALPRLLLLLRRILLEGGPSPSTTTHLAQPPNLPPGAPPSTPSTR
jgi:hypothetical protein